MLRDLSRGLFDHETGSGRRLAAIGLAGCAGLLAGPLPLRAAATTIAQPTYVRTIGGPNGEAIIYPSGVAVDASGNVYVADTGNYKVEKWAAGTGTPTPPVWSVGVRGEPNNSTTPSFQAPRDLAVDSSYVYVADTDNAAVAVLNASDGSLVKTVRTFGSGGSQHFTDPIGISVGSLPVTGEVILVSDGVTGDVFVFDTSFNLVNTIPPTKSNEGTRDAATDSAGYIYTADYRGNAVDVYGPSNNYQSPLTTWGGSGCFAVPKPYGVDVDTADTPNRIYVASSDAEQVKVFTYNGSTNTPSCLNVGTTGSNAIGTATKDPTSSTALFQLRRVAVGPGSNPLVYAADLWGLKILTYNSDGTIAASQPEIGNGTYPGAGNLNEPRTVSIDPTDGYVFAADMVNQRMERFNLDGSNPIAFGTKGVAESTASFNWAQGITYDPVNGDVWVANTRNNRIDEFTTAGTLVTSLPASGHRLTSPLNWPMQVAFDPSGTMYIADTYNNRVVAYTVSGTTPSQTPLWQTPKNEMLRPWGIAYDPTQGRLLVADTNKNRIVSLNPATGAMNGVLTGTAGNAPGDLRTPRGVAVDASGNVWVADSGNDRVEEFTSAGAFANQMIGSYGAGFTAPNTEFSGPQGLAFDSSGLLYVADSDNNRIQVFQPAAASGGPPAYKSQVYDAAGVAPLYPAGGESGAAGYMYIADSGRSDVDVVSSTGTLSYLTPDTGTPLSNPRNLSIDVTTPGDLWISDTGTNEIVEMSTSGHVLNRFGSTSGLTLKEPFGLANDTNGVYVADTYDNRIIQISKTDGHVIWSETACVLNGTTTPLSRPRDVTVGSDGNVYAVDTDHGRVVEFNTAGTCLASWTGTSPDSLREPRALSSDGAGGLWIAEDGNRPALVHFTDAGAYLGGTSNGGAFVEPEGVWMNGANIEVADPFAFTVDTFTAAGADHSGRATSTIYKGGPAVGGFNNPYGVAYDPSGNMYVTDMFNQRIEKFPAGGGSPIATGEFGPVGGDMQNPRGIAVSPDGSTVILTNSEDNRVDLFNASDLSFIKSIVPSCGKMFWPDQTAYDATDGTYWIADTNNSRILEVDGSGNCLENWKGTGVGISTPRGIAWDGSNVWVANTTHDQLLRCTPTGTCTVVVGRPVITSPWSLAIANNDIYVADEAAGKIDVFTLGGQLLYSFGSLGSNSTAGQFESPRSVAIDPSTGNIAVADFTADLVSIWH